MSSKSCYLMSNNSALFSLAHFLQQLAKIQVEVRKIYHHFLKNASTQTILDDDN